MPRSTASSLMLSPHEFSCILLTEGAPQRFSTLFAEDPANTAILRYYFFISNSIQQFDELLDNYRQEQGKLFEFLMEQEDFATQIAPMVREFRRQTRRTRYGPYQRTPPLVPTPPRSFSIEPPSSPSPESIFIQEAIQVRNSPTSSSSLSSFYTADELPGTKANPINVDDDIPPLPPIGSPNRPITISDDDECEGCHDSGHDILHCDKIYHLVGDKYVPYKKGESNYGSYHT
jgi:hypothetical protein